MFKGGVPLGKYLEQAVKREAERQQSKVMTSIKQDGYERLFWLAYRMKTKIQLKDGDKNRAYRVIGMTPRSAEDLTVEIKDEKGIKPPQEVPFIDHFVSKYHTAINHPYWPCLRLANENGVDFDFPIEYLEICEDPLKGYHESESSSGKKNDLGSPIVPSFVNRTKELNPKMFKGKAFDENDQVMFIGGYVNHAAKRSIAAVVGSVDWPRSKPFAAMVRAQTRGEDRIQRFGEACSKLVEAHTKESKKRPNKIVIFRYDVSNEILQDELRDLKNNFGGYTPTITVVVAKKHVSDPSLENKRDDNLDFYIYRLGVRFNFQIIYGNGSLSMSDLLFCLCDSDTTMETATPHTYTFRMVPPIIYAHLAAVRVRDGDPISDKSWIIHDVR